MAERPDIIEYADHASSNGRAESIIDRPVPPGVASMRWVWRALVIGVAVGLGMWAFAVVALLRRSFVG